MIIFCDWLLVDEGDIGGNRWMYKDDKRGIKGIMISIGSRKGMKYFFWWFPADGLILMCTIRIYKEWIDYRIKLQSFIFELSSL